MNLSFRRTDCDLKVLLILYVKVFCDQVKANYLNTIRWFSPVQKRENPLNNETH